MEVRRKDRMLDEIQINNILEKGVYGVLNTVGKDGYPYGVPINYSYKDKKIYFHCASMVGHKLDNIAYSNKISFTVVDKAKVLSDKFSMDYSSVVVFGKIYKVASDDKIAVLMNLVEKYASDYIQKGRLYAESAVEKTDVYVIIPERITGKGRK